MTPEARDRWIKERDDAAEALGRGRIRPRDEEHSYHPEPCTAPGHIFGCAGRAGGEHELELQPQPLGDDTRLEIGKLIFDKFFSGSPENGDREEMVKWLKAIGFNRVEVVQGDQDDILLVMLWRFKPGEPNYYGTLDEFILEFAGYDAAVITLFNVAAEVQL